MLLFKISEMVSDTADIKEEKALELLTDLDNNNIKKIVLSLEHFAYLLLLFSSRCPISIPNKSTTRPPLLKDFSQ